MDRSCCIPYCCKAEDDLSVTVHEFPSNPDVAARWIQNINLFLKNGGTWFPQSNSVICSSHFLPSDFNPTSKYKKLKRRSVPTMFVWRELKPKKVVKKPEPKSPMIVKVLNPVGSEETKSPSPVSFQNDTPPVVVSRDVPLPFKISQVVSLAGLNLPAGNNLSFLPSNFVTLPPKSIVSPLYQKAGVSAVAGGQSSLINAGIPITVPQFNAGTSFNSNQLILLPQTLSPPPPLGNSSYIIFPSGKPLPSPGEKIVLFQTSDPLPANKNVLQGQPNIMTSVSSNMPDKSLLNNQNRDISVQKSDYSEDITKTIMNSTSNLVDNFDDRVSPTVSKGTKGEDLISQSSTSPKEPEILKITQDSQETYSSDIRVSAQKRLSQSDKSIGASPCVKKKKVIHTKEKASDLIEIGPSTFMKINPDIIKVSKKQTPNGNTVLQFVMNSNIIGQDLKKPLFSFASSRSVTDKNAVQTNGQTFIEDLDNPDAHVPDSTSQNEDMGNGNCTENSPVLLTTTLPIQHTFSSMRMKYAKSLKLKSTQICRLNSKVKAFEKKIEELENKCIVQERQLNFASLKKLKIIKQDAERGVPHAAFILEQIRGYFGKNVRVNWSHSTLVQCSIWCRKAPYAYDYFKKDDLFRLPATNTIKRFMQRNPEVRLQIKNKAFRRTRNPGESSSSSDFDSDFDFDESDDENVPPSEDTNEIIIPVETILTCSQVIGEDSQSSSGVHFEPFVDTPTYSKSGESSIYTLSNSQPQLSDRVNIDSSPNDKNANLAESRVPLTNIFGKILCEMGGSMNRDIDQAPISHSVPSASEKSPCSELNDETLTVTSSIQSLVTTVTQSNSQSHVRTNDDGQELIIVGDSSDTRGLMTVDDDDSNSQKLMPVDVCSNNEELMTMEDFSNNQELIDTDNQKAMTTNEDGDSLLMTTEDSNIEATEVANENSNSYYLQTSERDGITTINVDGQEIIIPPGTILQLNSDLVSSDELGNHFLIIPPADYQINAEDHQYTTNPSLDDVTVTCKEVDSSVITDVTENDITDIATGV